MPSLIVVYHDLEVTLSIGRVYESGVDTSNHIKFIKIGGWGFHRRNVREPHPSGTFAWSYGFCEHRVCGRCRSIRLGSGPEWHVTRSVSKRDFRAPHCTRGGTLWSTPISWDNCRMAERCAAPNPRAQSRLKNCHSRYIHDTNLI